MHSDILERGEASKAEQQAHRGGTPAATLPPPDMRDAQKIRTIRLWISLLLVVCLGGLGSLSLAPSILPSLLIRNDTTGMPVQKTHLATPIASTSVPITGPFTESECIATPQNVKYAPSQSGNGNNQALPLAWLQAGRNQKDLANAQACAAAFIDTYQTFNSEDARSFETSVFMLTDGANKRFYGSALDTQPDRHMDPMWRASLLKQQVRQTAQSAQPSLLDVQYTGGTLLAWMAVQSQLTTQEGNGGPIIQGDQYVVLLVGVPINTAKNGTGWQVSQWQEGNTKFEPSRPL